MNLEDELSGEKPMVRVDVGRGSGLYFDDLELRTAVVNLRG